MVPLNVADTLAGSYSGVEALSGDPSQPNPLHLPRGVEVLHLDPHFTAPNVAVGVIIQGRPFILAPGDMLPLPPRTLNVGLFDPLGGYSRATALGGVAFMRLVGLTMAEAAIMQDGKDRPRGWGRQARIAEGRSTVWYRNTNLRHIRVTAYPLDAASVVMAAPADLAATIRAGVKPWMNYGVGATGMVDRRPDLGSVEHIAGGLYGGGGEFSPNADVDLTVSQNVRTFEREVMSPTGMVELSVTGLAGTGVSFLYLVVEGY